MMGKNFSLRLFAFVRITAPKLHRNPLQPGGRFLEWKENDKRADFPRKARQGTAVTDFGTFIRPSVAPEGGTKKRPQPLWNATEVTKSPSRAGAVKYRPTKVLHGRKEGRPHVGISASSTDRAITSLSSLQPRHANTRPSAWRTHDLSTMGLSVGGGRIQIGSSPGGARREVVGMATSSARDLAATLIGPEGGRSTDETGRGPGGIWAAPLGQAVEAFDEPGGRPTGCSERTAGEDLRSCTAGPYFRAMKASAFP